MRRQTDFRSGGLEVKITQPGDGIQTTLSDVSLSRAIRRTLERAASVLPYRFYVENLDKREILDR